MSVKNSKEIIYSQKKLIVNKFKKHKFAVYSFYFLTLLYTITTFAEFFSPYPTFQRNREFLYAPPSSLHFFDKSGKFSILPFVYELKGELDMKTFQRTYVNNDKMKYKIVFFPKVESYSMLFLHLIGNSSALKMEDNYFLWVRMAWEEMFLAELSMVLERLCM